MDAPDGQHYGYDLMKAADIKSGTLYPLLARLEKSGWIASSWEEADAADLGRGKRKYYQLTDKGKSVAISELRKLELNKIPAMSLGGNYA